MNNDIQPIAASGGEIVLYQPDENTHLEVRIEYDTVWLNRNQMATLFGRDVKTIGKHINNALREELSVVANNAPTVSKFAIVQIEGGREVTREVKLYNLDVIISLGYRVKSLRGTQFRIWATSVLRDHLLQGYSIKAA